MRLACLLLTAASLCPLAPFARAAEPPDWRQLIKDRLELYGHRNWIVIADSAYPAQSSEAIETIVSHSGQLEVLKEIVNDLSASKHVRAIPYTDRELGFLDDSDAPGVTLYRERLFGLLPEAKTNTTLHEDLIHKLAEVSQNFHVLIVKTNMTIPYTTVFLQLDCAYWSDAAEQKLRAAMAK